MDMRVDAKRIRAERERRAWSQEHLAVASGLGLRTIQRIEKTGAASFESARSLAAVFETDVADLRAPAEESVAVTAAAGSRRWFRAKPMLGGAAAALTAAGALFVATKDFASDVVKLDVGVSMNESRLEQTEVITGANDNVALRAIDDRLRMVIVPTIEQNGILLATEIYVLEGRHYVLASAPKVLTKDGKEARIVLTTKDGTSFRFSITPHQNPPTVPPTLQAV